MMMVMMKEPPRASVERCPLVGLKCAVEMIIELLSP